jgi:hypothetical protein
MLASKEMPAAATVAARHSIVGVARLPAFNDQKSKARNFGTCENFNGHADGEDHRDLPWL